MGMATTTKEGRFEMAKGVFYMRKDGSVSEFECVGDLHRIASLLEQMPNVLRAWVASKVEDEDAPWDFDNDDDAEIERATAEYERAMYADAVRYGAE